MGDATATEIELLNELWTEMYIAAARRRAPPARDEMPAPAKGEKIPALVERLARWHRRLLAARSNNSSTFFPHHREDGYLSDDLLAAMIALEALVSLRDALEHLTDLYENNPSAAPTPEHAVALAHVRALLTPSGNGEGTT